MPDLSQQTTQPENTALTTLQMQQYAASIGNWTIVDSNDSGEAYLERRFRFDNFEKAMRFVIALNTIIEQQQHYPQLEITHQYVRIRFGKDWPDNCLRENDFIMAAHTDKLYQRWLTVNDSNKQVVDEALEETFPASDPPAF